MALGSAAARDAVLDASLSGTDAPASLYLALFTDSTCTTEVTGGGYARVAVAKSDWSASSGGTKSISGAVSFPVSSGAWTGTATYSALMSASTGGDRWDTGPLGSSLAVTAAGTIVTFPAGTLSVSEA
jgi:hypothetical protein